VTADRVDIVHKDMDKHYDKVARNEQMERREDCLVDVSERAASFVELNLRLLNQ
jgi:hypothetical protein